MAQEKWHKVHDRKKWHNFISAENRNKYIFQIVYFTDKKNGKGPPKKTKGRPRARMTSPSDGSPTTVFAAMFLRARMTEDPLPRLQQRIEIPPRVLGRNSQ